MSSRACLAIVLVSLVAVAMPSAASAKTETDTSGQVTASLSYTKVKGGIFYKDVKVTIFRGTDRLLSAPIKGFGPGGFQDEKSVQVVDLDGDEEPEVVLNLFSGGAHCCTTAYVYRYQSSTKAYVRSEEFFGDIGFRVRDLDAKEPPEFLSVDPAFSGAFTSYAESGFPIQIKRFAGGRFTTVTAKFPSLVRKDLAALKRFYAKVRKRKGNARGALAAVAADQYTLGATKSAKATVAKGRKLYGKRFAASLMRFLKRNGYAR